MRVTFGTLCSGIGAPEVAGERIGWLSRFCSEIAPFPVRVLRERFHAGGNGPKLFGDFTAAPIEEFPDVDVVVAGTPCQAFSVAGDRASLYDARGNLTLKFVEFCHDLAARAERPLRNALWENVPGVLNTFDNAFGCFLGGLVGTDAPICPPGAVWGAIDPDTGAIGWESCRFTRAGMVCGPRGRAAWRVFNSQYFGLAQRRERVFVVADFGNGADPAAVLFERRGGSGSFIPSDGAREDDTGAVEDRAGIGGLAFVPQVAGTLKSGDGGGDAHIGQFVPEVAWALQERDAKGPDSSTKDVHLIPMAFKMRGRDGGNTPEIMPGGISPALSTDGGGSSLPFIFKPSHFTRGKDGAPSQISPPLSADADKGDQDALICYLRGLEWEVRRLTPLECCRLQGFADDHTAIKRAAATPQYSALGNAMSVPVVEWIMRRIDMHIPPR